MKKEWLTSENVLLYVYAKAMLYCHRVPKQQALEMQCNTPTYEESSCEKQVRIARIRVH